MKIAKKQGVIMLCVLVLVIFTTGCNTINDAKTTVTYSLNSDENRAEGTITNDMGQTIEVSDGIELECVTMLGTKTQVKGNIVSGTTNLAPGEKKNWQSSDLPVPPKGDRYVSCNVVKVHASK
jgi:hypothetical protein